MGRGVSVTQFPQIDVICPVFPDDGSRCRSRARNADRAALYDFRRFPAVIRTSATPLGQRDLRRLLVTGAMTVRHASRRGEITDPWLAGMLARKPKMLVAVALAKRTARRVWALATRKETYRVRAAA